MPPVPHNSRRSRSVPRSGRKKALIIGIDYQDWTTPDGEEPEFARLYGPHKDATSFKQMLICGLHVDLTISGCDLIPHQAKYHYKEKDITLMLDKKKGVHENLRPTYKNIVGNES